MKSKTDKIEFDRYFAARMKDREFAAGYAQARKGIDSVDAFMRSLAAARATAGVSKAKLAQLTGTQPAAMRRLLTTDAPNPTLSTVMSILKSLGYGLVLVPKRPQVKQGRARKEVAHDIACRVLRAGSASSTAVVAQLRRRPSSRIKRVY